MRSFWAGQVTSGIGKSIRSLAFLILLSPAGYALAEGACPPGQYPIGGQGVQGCAPIPSSGADSGSGSPRPTGVWHKTWGAIAISTDGAAGASTGKLSKADAAKDSEVNCAKSGGRSCKVAFTFKNQCGAATVPTSGDGGTSFGRAETKEKAEKLAMDRCASDGGIGCNVIYAACAQPEFESY